MFNGVEIRRIWWEVKDSRAGRVDQLADAVEFVCRQVVHDHYISGLELWTQHVLKVSHKNVSIRRRFHRHQGYPSLNADGPQQHQCAPIAWRAVRDARADGFATIAASHFRGDTAFIEKDQILRRALGDGLTELPPQPLYSLAVLLGGAQSFF